MKALKIIGGIILLLILAMFLIGLISPRAEYENSITINAPVEEVWQVFTDSEKIDQWLYGVTGIEKLEGEPLTSGSRFKLFFDVDGEQFEITEEVTDVEPNKRYAFSMQSEPLNSKVDISFTVIDSAKTQLTALTTAEGNGVLWKPIIRFSGSMMKQQSQISYENLKLLVESE
ncbi:SRPBCC family protein [Balneolaceae bacterium YR4-1]|uniref:SRPBCC family protein n=1 Tax=Halalkalibaculum roseum TaxID=2709311 RepID=A0A6M1T2K4_9BACT|nr:SRPBCC family protein [Halalkalibaculum roseum]NGP77744.1 SRPBCC family protein [Halalkalibaculum roseum]